MKAKFLAAEQHLAAVDPVMAKLIHRWGHCTLSKSPNTFLTIVESIASQQLSIKAADTIFKRFLKLFRGNPTPPKLLALSHDQLRGVGFSNMKALYLKDLSAKITNGELILDDLPQLPDEAVIHELIKVKGIGRWTAEMYLMFTLNRLDVFPKDDLGIRTAINRLYHRSPPIDKWRPYRTIASWYLWRELDNKP